METKATIDADVRNMLTVCSERCTFMNDLTQNCTSKCFTDYGKQKENFLIRKYTQQCSGLPFDEEWTFKIDNKSRSIDLGNTFDTYDKWNNPAIANCSKKYLSEHKQLIDKLLEEKNRERAEFKKEHPVISTVVDLNSSIRYKK
jgi:hypothetical protein